MKWAFVSFWRKSYEDNLTGMAAMVAYNLMLSVFPLALVALFVAGRVLASENVEASVVDDLRRLFPEAADSTLLDGLRRVRQSSTTVGIVAVVAATWFSSSFWGALDTAFCRIYHRECRSWVQQKLFGLGMLAVVLLFFAATVSIPALQGFVIKGTKDLPLGLGDVRALVYGLTLAGGLVLLLGVLCLVYWRVPRGPIPWRCIWPGALFAVIAMGAVDYVFPLYLSNVSSLRIGTSFLFVLIVLVWFYVLSLILLAGAEINELRFEAAVRRLQAMADPKTEELRVEQVKRERSEHDRAREADQPDEERQHERRAERAEYLREKLDERAESEDRVEDDA
jgi:YihY family inner membrane protein